MLVPSEQPENERTNMTLEKEADAAAVSGLARCPRCWGTVGQHGFVHVRHGNGGGHNRPCPLSQLTPPAPAEERSS